MDLRDSICEEIFGKHLSRAIQNQDIQEPFLSILEAILEDIHNNFLKDLGLDVYKIQDGTIIREYYKKYSSYHMANFHLIQAIKILFEKGIILREYEDSPIELSIKNKELLLDVLTITNPLVYSNLYEVINILGIVDFSRIREKRLESNLFEINIIMEEIEKTIEEGEEAKKKLKEKLKEILNFLIRKKYISLPNNIKSKFIKQYVEILELIIPPLLLRKKFASKSTLFIIKQVFGQNLLPEVFALSKSIKLGLYSIPKICIIKKDEFEIAEFDILIDDSKCMLVEITLRKNIENKINKITHALEELRQYFHWMEFYPLLIGLKRDDEIPFINFEEFFNMNNKNNLLERVIK
ncbi:MAG: hypothetical protein NZ922_06920 [Candidatus Methanomethyliaceae archaeon]|nr:hypothetical protein [Candidatus Methanomethyliaceae archaeon]